MHYACFRITDVCLNAGNLCGSGGFQRNCNWSVELKSDGNLILITGTINFVHAEDDDLKLKCRTRRISYVDVDTYLKLSNRRFEE